MKRTSEAAFEEAIEATLLESGEYRTIPSKAFDRESAIFPDIALDFIRTTQPKT